MNFMREPGPFWQANAFAVSRTGSFEVAEAALLVSALSKMALHTGFLRGASERGRGGNPQRGGRSGARACARACAVVCPAPCAVAIASANANAGSGSDIGYAGGFPFDHDLGGMEYPRRLQGNPTGNHRGRSGKIRAYHMAFLAFDIVIVMGPMRETKTAGFASGG